MALRKYNLTVGPNRIQRKIPQFKTGHLYIAHGDWDHYLPNVWRQKWPKMFFSIQATFNRLTWTINNSVYSPPQGSLELDELRAVFIADEITDCKNSLVLLEPGRKIFVKATADEKGAVQIAGWRKALMLSIKERDEHKEDPRLALLQREDLPNLKTMQDVDDWVDILKAAEDKAKETVQDKAKETVQDKAKETVQDKAKETVQDKAKETVQAVEPDQPTAQSKKPAIYMNRLGQLVNPNPAIFTTGPQSRFTKFDSKSVAKVKSVDSRKKTLKAREKRMQKKKKDIDYKRSVRERYKQHKKRKGIIRRIDPDLRDRADKILKAVGMKSLCEEWNMPEILTKYILKESCVLTMFGGKEFVELIKNLELDKKPRSTHSQVSIHKSILQLG